MPLNESKSVNIPTRSARPSPSAALSCTPSNRTTRALIRAGQKGLKPAIGLSDSLRCRILKGFVSEIVNSGQPTVNVEVFLLDKQRRGKKGSTDQQSAEEPCTKPPSDLEDTTGFTVPLSSIEATTNECKTCVYVPASHYDTPQRTMSSLENLSPDIMLCQISSSLHTDRSCDLLLPNDPTGIKGADSVLATKPAAAFDESSVDSSPVDIEANVHAGSQASVIALINRVLAGDKTLDLELAHAHIRMKETPDELFDQFINVPDGDDGEWGLDCPVSDGVN